MPFNGRLSSSSLVRLHISSFVHKLVVLILVVIENVKMSWVKKIAVRFVTKIYYPALLTLPVGICDSHTFVTIALLHPAYTVKSHEAITLTLSFMVPMRTSILIIFEPSRESVGHLRCCLGVTGNRLIADVSVRNADFLFDGKRKGQHK